MSMNDMSYCSTKCLRLDCERNMRYNKPTTKYYSATGFDCKNKDPLHKTCKWMRKKTGKLL